jgi:RsiW-degrading membrane proteinase PrsW (M82 family)
MKIKRAIVLGIAIWSIGILLYSTSYYVPILENVETQANLVLFIAVIPLVWLGCTFYYKKDNQTHGYLVGQTMLLTAVALDALITVPFYVIPKGGSHYSFFTSLGFWVIAFEFLLVAVSYWYACVFPQRKPSKQ